MPRAVRDFSPIYSTEQVVISFDFNPPPINGESPLAPGEVLVTAAVSIVLVLGPDPTPSLRLIGNPSISGSLVLQAVGTYQPGSTYDLIATVVTSAGQTLTLNAHQSCLSIQ